MRANAYLQKVQNLHLGSTAMYNAHIRTYHQGAPYHRQKEQLDNVLVFLQLLYNIDEGYKYMQYVSLDSHMYMYT